MGSEEVAMTLLNMASPRLSRPGPDHTRSGQGKRALPRPKAGRVAVQAHPSWSLKTAALGPKQTSFLGTSPQATPLLASLPSGLCQPSRVMYRPCVEKGLVEIEKKAKKM